MTSTGHEGIISNAMMQCVHHVKIETPLRATAVRCSRSVEIVETVQGDVETVDGLRI